jgi:ribosomal protein L11 methylase PrmA
MQLKIKVYTMKTLMFAAVALLGVSSHAIAADFDNLVVNPAHAETDLNQATKAYIKAKMDVYKACRTPQ